MRWRPVLVTCGLGLLFAAAPASAELYRWVDENGELHFTSDLHQVPPAYRDRAAAPRADEKSTLNVAPPPYDPDQQHRRDQRMRSLRRRNAPPPKSKPGPLVLERPRQASPAASDPGPAPRKYDRDCSRIGRNGRCHAQLNPDWVRWNGQRQASEPAADD